jgi:hypothetical protein
LTRAKDREGRAWRIRPLTDGERGLAKRVFGDQLRLDTVRFIGSPWPFDRAFVAGRWFGREWIAWPHKAMGNDYSQAKLRRRATFVHELVHVWQAQQGINLALAKLRAGDTADAYGYVADEYCRWDGLNIEQQAMVVEHAYRLSEGESVQAAVAFYRSIAPFPCGLDERHG